MTRFAALILMFAAAAYGQTFGSANAARIRGRNVDPTAPVNLQTLVWKCAIPSAVFTGAGLNDASAGGTCTSDTASLYEVIISSATASPDEFKWRKDGGSLSVATAMTGAAQTIADGVTITFKATDGHTLADAWAIATTVSWIPSAVGGGGGAPDAVLGASTLITPGDIPQVSATPGVLEVSRLNCALGVCTLEAAAGGPSTFVVKASVDQGGTDLFQVKNAAGAVVGGFDSVAGLSASAFGIRGGGIGGISSTFVGVASDSKINFSSTWQWFATPDLSLLRKTSTPGVLRVGDGSTGYGSVEANNLTAVALSTPLAPTVTPTCAADCTETWGYKIVAKAGDGTVTLPGTEGTTAVQNATLSASDKNVLTWAAVTGATSYEVWMTTSGGTPATLGKIATVTAATYSHEGANGDGGTAPTGNTTGSIVAKIQTPASAAVACTAGAIWTDANFIYVCTATGVVKSVAIATF